jgi:hypothetical protein
MKTIQHCNSISVSQDAIKAVLDTFIYSADLTQSEISQLAGISEMTVSRAVRRLKQDGILDSREHIDAKGSRKHTVIYPRDIASILIFDLSGATMDAVLFDTSLTPIGQAQYIYNSMFDYEDNLRKFLNIALSDNTISQWNSRKITPTLPYGPRRNERMRRSRAKKIAGLVAKMKLCLPPVTKLGIILPNEYTRAAIGADACSAELIYRTVCDVTLCESVVCFSAREAVMEGAPSVSARAAVKAAVKRTALADARSLLFVGNGIPFGNKDFILYMCRSGAHAAWRLPDGADGDSFFASTQTFVSKEYLSTIVDFIKPDIIAVDENLFSKAPFDNSIPTDGRHTATVGAAIILRRSAWEEYKNK